MTTTPQSSRRLSDTNLCDPRRNEAVNKRDLSTGENGEFGAEVDPNGAQRRSTRVANASGGRVAGDRTSRNVWDNSAVS